MRRGEKLKMMTTLTRRSVQRNIRPPRCQVKSTGGAYRRRAHNDQTGLPASLRQARHSQGSRSTLFRWRWLALLYVRAVIHALFLARLVPFFYALTRAVIGREWRHLKDLGRRSGQ